MHALIFTGGEENPLFDRMFADLKKDGRVRFVSSLPHPGAMKGLYRLHHKRGLNRRRPAPLRGIWKNREYEALVREEASLHPGLCLIFNNFSIPSFEPAQLKHWKKDLGVRLVLCFIDRLSSWFAAEARMYMKNIPFDLIYSYSRRDAENYGLRYFDQYFSKAEITAERRGGVYFWGSDTGRRETLEAVWKRLDALREKCSMGICYAQGDGERLPGIVYDSPKEYEELLKDTAAADTLLDIIAGEGGVSLRYFEAIAYGKKLISNNPEVKHMRFYDPRQVLLIRSPEDISREFLDAEFTPYTYTDEFSPIRWIDRIAEDLQLS